MANGEWRQWRVLLAWFRLVWNLPCFHLSVKFFLVCGSLWPKLWKFKVVLFSLISIDKSNELYLLFLCHRSSFFVSWHPSASTRSSSPTSSSRRSSSSWWDSSTCGEPTMPGNLSLDKYLVNQLSLARSRGTWQLTGGKVTSSELSLSKREQSVF